MTRQRTPGVAINACYGYVNVVMLEADSLATYQPGRSRPLHVLQQRLSAAFDGSSRCTVLIRQYGQGMSG